MTHKGRHIVVALTEREAQVVELLVGAAVESEGDPNTLAAAIRALNKIREGLRTWTPA